MPELENVMYNFIGCSSLMFGAGARYGISFKTNQPGFDIFTRKCYHNFKGCITSKNFEGAVGCTMGDMGMYALAETLNIGLYD